MEVITVHSRPITLCTLFYMCNNNSQKVIYFTTYIHLGFLRQRVLQPLFWFLPSFVSRLSFVYFEALLQCGIRTCYRHKGDCYWSSLSSSIHKGSWNYSGWERSMHCDSQKHWALSAIVENKYPCVFLRLWLNYNSYNIQPDGLKCFASLTFTSMCLLCSIAHFHWILLIEPQEHCWWSVKWGHLSAGDIHTVLHNHPMPSSHCPTVYYSTSIPSRDRR